MATYTEPSDIISVSPTSATDKFKDFLRVLYDLEPRARKETIKMVWEELGHNIMSDKSINWSAEDGMCSSCSCIGPVYQMCCLCKSEDITRLLCERCSFDNMKCGACSGKKSVLGYKPVD